MQKQIIGVVGGHAKNTTAKAIAFAEGLGGEIARRGMAVVCGGFDGVMEGVCKGCREAGGTTIGVLKGNNPATANRYVEIPIVTSMDVACNNIVVWTSSGIIALEGRYGTLNEIALALDFGKPLVLVGKHELLTVGNIQEKHFKSIRSYDETTPSAVLNLLCNLMSRANAQITSSKI